MPQIIKSKERCACVCGCEIGRPQLKRHMKTNKHRVAMEQMKIMADRIDELLGDADKLIN
mgnify:CR=1 FL=1|tara:strand:- start:267 stop:446 length:180 start_codon:yes stop_codon:yes gene_type:complete